MYETFESLPEDKKRNIIESCIEEFAENGFENTSTNAIVKRANISKGILFHYFGNKKNLYLYILDYAIDFMVTKFYAMDFAESHDVFERLIEWSIRKIQIAKKEPSMFKILMSAFVNVPSDLQSELEHRWNRVKEQNFPRFIENIDTSKFRAGVDPHKAIELVLLTLDTLGKKYIDQMQITPNVQINEMEAMVEDYKTYMEILKGGIYGEENG